MRTYKCIENQVFSKNGFSIVPIRDEDKYLIMQWRNEQMYHLRQSKPLTREVQEAYFGNVIKELFNEEVPDQLLFSYLKNGTCIGYGGLVHINWVDKNAEISFIMDTALEPDFFEFHWIQFLSLIEELAFVECGLHKIFTYAYDLRPRLYQALLESNFNEEAKLKEQVYFNSKYIDVLIHVKLNAVS